MKQQKLSHSRPQVARDSAYSFGCGHGDGNVDNGCFGFQARDFVIPGRSVEAQMTSNGSNSHRQEEPVMRMDGCAFRAWSAMPNPGTEPCAKLERANGHEDRLEVAGFVFLIGKTFYRGGAFH